MNKLIQLLNKIINSDVFFEAAESSSIDLVNTIKSCCENLHKCYEPTEEDADSAKQNNRKLTNLNHNQTWQFILLNLCKQIGLFNEESISDISNFYAEVKDWHHDQHLFIILLMIKHGILLDFSQIPDSIKSTENDAINLI